MMKDKELLAMLKDPKTQREGFAVLVSQYSEPLYWKVRHIVIDHDDADDVLQNAFVKAWTNLDSFQGKSSLSTWLYRIAINEALDFLRRKKQMVNVSTEDEPGLASRLLADDYFDGDQIQAELQEAVAQRPCCGFEDCAAGARPGVSAGGSRIQRSHLRPCVQNWQRGSRKAACSQRAANPIRSGLRRLPRLSGESIQLP